MKRYYIYIVLLFLAVGCSKETLLEPSLKDRNWFEIIDDANDPVKHKTYQIYKETGTPVFYNDLLGIEDRGVDSNGNPLIFEKRLDINYTIAGSTVTSIEKKFTLLDNEADIMAGLDFVQNNFINSVPEKFFIHSIFLVDSLYEQQYAGGQKKTSNCHKGLNTFVIANVKKLSSMSEQEKSLFNDKLLTYLAINQLANSNITDMEKFQKVSYDPINAWYYYGMNVQKPRYPGFKCLPPDRWEVYGFLDYNRTKYSNVETESDIQNWQYVLPAKEEDIEAYIAAALSTSEDEFNAKYSSYPMVMSKYSIMRKILVEIGFSVK